MLTKLYGGKFLNVKKMTKEDWQNLYENFESTDLLSAIDHLDKVRGSLANDENFRPPEIRNELMDLHALAVDVVNYEKVEKAEEF